MGRKRNSGGNDKEMVRNGNICKTNHNKSSCGRVDSSKNIKRSWHTPVVDLSNSNIPQSLVIGTIEIKSEDSNDNITSLSNALHIFDETNKCQSNIRRVSKDFSNSVDFMTRRSTIQNGRGGESNPRNEMIARERNLSKKPIKPYTTTPHVICNVEPVTIETLNFGCFSKKQNTVAQISNCQLHPLDLSMKRVPINRNELVNGEKDSTNVSNAEVALDLSVNKQSTERTFDESIRKKRKPRKADIIHYKGKDDVRHNINRNPNDLQEVAEEIPPLIKISSNGNIETEDLINREPSANFMINQLELDKRVNLSRKSDHQTFGKSLNEDKMVTIPFLNTSTSEPINNLTSLKEVDVHHSNKNRLNKNVSSCNKPSKLKSVKNVNCVVPITVQPLGKVGFTSKFKYINVNQNQTADTNSGKRSEPQNDKRSENSKEKQSKIKLACIRSQTEIKHKMAGSDQSKGDYIKTLNFSEIQAIKKITSLNDQNIEHIGQNASPLGQNTLSLGQNRQPIEQNTQLLGQNTPSIEQNTQSLGQNTQPTEQNTQSLGQNAQSIEQNTQSLGQNTQSIEQNTKSHAKSFEQNNGQGEQKSGKVVQSKDYSEKTYDSLNQLKQSVEQTKDLSEIHLESVEHTKDLSELHHESVEHTKGLSELQHESVEHTKDLSELHHESVEHTKDLPELHQESVEQDESLGLQNNDTNGPVIADTILSKSGRKTRSSKNSIAPHHDISSETINNRKNVCSVIKADSESDQIDMNNKRGEIETGLNRDRSRAASTNIKITSINEENEKNQDNIRVVASNKVARKDKKRSSGKLVYKIINKNSISQKLRDSVQGPVNKVQNRKDCNQSNDNDVNDIPNKKRLRSAQRNDVEETGSVSKRIQIDMENRQHLDHVKTSKETNPYNMVDQASVVQVVNQRSLILSNEVIDCYEDSHDKMITRQRKVKEQSKISNEKSSVKTSKGDGNIFYDEIEKAGDIDNGLYFDDKQIQTNNNNGNCENLKATQIAYDPITNEIEIQEIDSLNNGRLENDFNKERIDNVTDSIEHRTKGYEFIERENKGTKGMANERSKTKPIENDNNESDDDKDGLNKMRGTKSRGRSEKSPKRVKRKFKGDTSLKEQQEGSLSMKHRKKCDKEESPRESPRKRNPSRETNIQRTLDEVSKIQRNENTDEFIKTSPKDSQPSLTKSIVTTDEVKTKDAENEHRIEGTKETTKFQCCFCDKLWQTASALRKHLRYHKGSEKIIFCRICGEYFDFKTKLDKHMKSHKTVHKCETCHKEFKNQSSLKHHLPSHSSDRPFSCDMCKRNFKTFKVLRDHIRYGHSNNNQKSVCPHCSKEYKNQSSLREHMQRCILGDERPYQCTECQASFKSNSSRSAHIREVHRREKKYTCEICGLSFARKMMVESHMTTHTGDRPFTCDQCGKSFAKKATLTRHIRVHTGERPYVCKICGKSYPRHFSLVEHSRIHSGVMPYECDICQLTFRHSKSHRRHMLVHSGHRPYTCDKCDKSFFDRDCLKSHQKLHSDVRAYKCDVCQDSFKWLSSN